MLRHRRVFRRSHAHRNRFSPGLRKTHEHGDVEEKYRGGDEMTTVMRERVRANLASAWPARAALFCLGFRYLQVCVFGSHFGGSLVSQLKSDNTSLPGREPVDAPVNAPPALQ